MASAVTTRRAWLGSTLVVALVGSLLLWAALPPLAVGWMGWIAPVPWLLLVRRDELSGQRPYAVLWLAGFAFWLLAIHWLRLPHPATYLGWLTLSGYLAFYLPVFVGLSRVAVHRLGVPLWLTAPVVFTGLELARAHLLTGFLMASLAHTQVRWTPLIQVSDLAGEYGLDFVMMTVAAGIASALYPPRRYVALAPGALLLAGTLAYGYARMDERALGPATEETKGPRIALIQGNSLAEWKLDPSRERQIMDEYLALSDQAVATAQNAADGRPLDLVVWPETMFRNGLVTFAPDYKLPADIDRTKEEIVGLARHDLASLVHRLHTPVLVGIDRAHFSATSLPPLRYNSAAMVARDGQLVGTYDKMHRVMFGEYIPFADWFPFLYGLTPLTGGIEPGREPAGLELDGATYVPNICYETAIPHVIRRQVATLAARGQSPAVLVNLTNDAWYWGSSELDQHLACGVFRAVETRCPLVIAANGGISAWIDHLGRIRAESPRQQPDTILADVELSSMKSAYVRCGDWFAAVCLTCCVLLAVVGWRRRQR